MCEERKSRKSGKSEVAGFLIRRRLVERQRIVGGAETRGEALREGPAPPCRALPRSPRFARPFAENCTRGSVGAAERDRSPRKSRRGGRWASVRARRALTPRVMVRENCLADTSRFPPPITGEGNTLAIRAFRSRGSAGCSLSPVPCTRSSREGCAPGGPGRRRARDRPGNDAKPGRGGGPARLGTVVSCPTARAARPGAKRRDTPTPAVRAVRRSLVYAAPRGDGCSR